MLLVITVVFTGIERVLYQESRMTVEQEQEQEHGTSDDAPAAASTEHRAQATQATQAHRPHRHTEKFSVWVGQYEYGFKIPVFIYLFLTEYRKLVWLERTTRTVITVLCCPVR